MQEVVRSRLTRLQVPSSVTHEATRAALKKLRELKLLSFRPAQEGAAEAQWQARLPWNLSKKEPRPMADLQSSSDDF